MSIPSHHPYRSAQAKREYLALDEKMARDWPVASEQMAVKTTWGETFVRISGPAAAPPLVLLPGHSTSSLLWTGNIEALAARYRTYALDRNGDVGRSTCTRVMKNIDDLMNWLDQVFTVLSPGVRINLAGLSYGGWLTAEYALRFPDRLRSIVMIAPGGTVQRLSAQFFLRSVLLGARNRWLSETTLRWLFADLYRKEPARLEVISDGVQTVFKSRSNLWTIGPRLFEDSELKALRTPALFIVGEHEKIYSARKAVERLTKIAPQIQTDVIPGAGHDLTLVQSERVCRRILEFLGGID